ncbi:hypothetical protein [Ekhidna sp.]|uniref:hypothetical protein n=1 Tax=Ekhidna sp. TaxID=2608089 RepID=UPI003B58DAA8
MSRLIDLKILVLLLVLASCQKLKPESVSIPEYPDFENLIKTQADLLGNTRIKKTVRLENRTEVKIVEMDSAKWAEELSFLKEINPNQPEYVGAFTKETDGNKTLLTLGPDEKGELKKISYIKIGDIYSTMNATFHEDKDVYVHHRDINVTFRDGLIQSVEINGYQKMMFRDTVRFGINIKVL